MIFRSLALAAIVAGAATPAIAQKYDTVIVNGRVMDGTGSTWFHSDVAIRDGRIAEIGEVDESQAAKVLDAKGRIVAPGFIDVHTHADDGLYELPLAENFIRNGVTTIVTGNCGGSVIDVGEYFDNLTTTTVSLNVATLIGHNSVLRAVKGNGAWELTPEQMEKAKAVVAKAMDDGAVGFSTGLIYTPGIWSRTEEIIELNRVSAQRGGIYASHMRSESSGIMSAIDEALRIGRESGGRVQISHFKLPADMQEKIGIDATLKAVEAARAAGQEVWVDQYPYTASSTTISTMLPDWVLEEGPDAAKAKLKDGDTRQRALDDMRQNHEINRSRTSMEYAVIASASKFPGFGGMNIKEAAQLLRLRRERGDESLKWADVKDGELPGVSMREQFETVFDIYANGGAGMVFHTMNEEAVEHIMRSPLVAICSDSGVRKFGSGVPHPRGYGSNARVLGRYVRERQVITLEEAIRKMTSMPALAFRLADRGSLRPGNWADIVVFDPETVAEKSTFDEPHAYSVGFQYVIVNGEVVVEDDTVTGKRPGMAIRGPGYKAPKDVALAGE